MTVPASDIVSYRRALDMTPGLQHFLTVLAAAAALTGCNDSRDPEPVPPPPAPPPQVALACDDGIKTAFKPDSNTNVLLVKQFKQGDAILLSGTANAGTPVAAKDFCLVKLLVGPGNPGPAGAPSTSAGIGIEVWLPTAANWNERIRANGNGGWAGTNETSPTQVSGAGDGAAIKAASVAKGFVVSTSDNGHVGGASFAMNPDGTINTVLWRDFAERSLHEQAEKTKALARLYYAKPHKFAYFDGYSTGGRQALKLAQVYPNDFDGVLVGAPAINWTKFITSELYPQIVMRQDLGVNIAQAKLDALTTSAINACGGATLGFLLDPLSCRYDPTKDAAALCAGSAGNAGVTGTNANAAICANLREAAAVNKIWYGQTANGAAPDPAIDNGAGPYPGSNTHLWFGLTRGTSLGALAGAAPFPIATDLMALELQDPTYGSPAFVNASGNGTNKWASLDYGGLTNAAFQGVLLQPSFSNINTDNPDLSAFNNRKGKVLLYHGLADNLIPPQGSLNYYHRVAAGMGGIAEIQKFFRLYLVPGLSHSGALTGGPTVPLPQSPRGRDELFTALQNWVENGTGPDRIDVTSSDATVSIPLCVYPQKISYNGTGAVTAAASYSCK
jgi:feruloyl esterase